MGKQYHLTFSTKYRKSIFSFPNLRYEVSEILKEKANGIGCTIIALKILPDHVHVFLEAQQGRDIKNAIRLLKGYSSFRIRKMHPELTNIKALWAGGHRLKEVDSPVYAQNVIRYIDNQFEHHHIKTNNE